MGGEGQNSRQRCNLRVRVYGKLLECISSILEQKLDCLNRTQTSLKLAFFSVTAHEYSIQTGVISKESRLQVRVKQPADFTGRRLL